MIKVWTRKNAGAPNGASLIDGGDLRAADKATDMRTGTKTNGQSSIRWPSLQEELGAQTLLKQKWVTVLILLFFSVSWLSYCLVLSCPLCVYCVHKVVAVSISESRLYLWRRSDDMSQVANSKACELVIKNLGDEVEDKLLRKKFAPNGTVRSARVVKDGACKSQGLGYVCYSTSQEASLPS